MKLTLQTLKLKTLCGAIVCGVLISLATAFIEREPQIGIPEYKYYGYPLAWYVTRISQPSEILLASFFVDAVFWIAISLLLLTALEKIIRARMGTTVDYRSFLLPLMLFVPFGLLMDFVHEMGHALWGTAVGGRLTYMKIAFLEIYPEFSLTSTFVLGLVRFEGLTTDFAYGVMILGGSLTTNIVAWFLAAVLARTNLKHKKRVAMKILGLFGVFDLPFYVLFPQIGLKHWVFLGGSEPEPLMGARMVGVPDWAFYTIVVLATLGLVFLYFRPFWKKGRAEIKPLVNVKNNCLNIEDAK